jgi:hypothetical protein
MRWIRWAFVPLAVCALMSAVTGFDCTSVEGGTCASCSQSCGYGAPACAAPFFGWQPGCCESPPSPCDNAWAGYCQEKARCKAFWCRLGTGGRTCYGTPSGGCEPMAVSPKPFVQPVPAPTAEPAVDAAPALPDELSLPAPPGESLEAPLPPPPAAPEEPTILPPLPRPVPDEATWTWDRSWMPPSTARGKWADWPRLR